MRKSISILLGGISFGALALAIPAAAQDSGSISSQDSQTDDEMIVVTGTLIRGIAPAGASVISVGRADIEESGAAGGNDILATIPQISNFFNQMPDVGGNNPFGVGAAPIARPNLRSLPGNNVNSGSLTLVMLDGHRIAPGGLTQIAVDPDVVPPSLLERVEIMPDGASAVYGSDALGGVINFITRRSFDGVEASARYGFGKNSYNSWDANITAGKDWGSGSLFASFSYAYHDPIFGRDRDFIREIDWNPASPTTGLGTERACEPGNIVIGARTYPLTASGSPQSNTLLPNTCDGSDGRTVYSKDRKIGIFAGLSQQLSDSLRIDIRGFYSRRNSITFNGPLRASPVITSANPNYRNVGALNPADAGASQTVRFSYGNVITDPQRENILETWQITPTITWDVGGDWQLRVLGSYGENETGLVSESVNNALQTARINAGLINPYNVDASAPGAFDNLIGLSQQRAQIEFQNLRVVADGPLLTLPGGELRVAAGAEYISINFSRRQTDAAFVLGAPLQYKQTVKALFGELQVPIFGENNRFGGVYALQLQGSIRHDRYNDFGGTTNPSLGITYSPVEWVKLRGIWGKSFVAPSATAQLGTSAVGLIVSGSPGFPLEVPVGAPPPPPGALGLLLNMGSIANLQPQTSKNWSISADISPPIVPGLTLSASYYAIDVAGILSSPLSAGQPQLFRDFPHLYTLAPPGGFTPQQIQNWLAFATPAAQAAYIPFSNTAVNPVYILIDNRTRNLGTAKVRGIDFSVRYRTEVGFGSLDFSIAGNRELTNETQNGAGLPTNNLLLLDTPLWKWGASAGFNAGGLRGRLTWNHTGGYAVNPALNAGQTRVSAFNTVDAFLSYAVGGEGITKGLEFTLNVSNIFDQDPPILRRAGFQNFGFAPTSFTVGRLVQVGIRNRF